VPGRSRAWQRRDLAGQGAHRGQTQNRCPEDVHGLESEAAPSDFENADIFNAAFTGKAELDAMTLKSVSTTSDAGGVRHLTRGLSAGAQQGITPWKEAVDSIPSSSTFRNPRG